MPDPNVRQKAEHHYYAALDLVLEGHGNDPDRIIADDELVSLDKDKGPLRFSSAPKANFG